MAAQAELNNPGCPAAAMRVRTARVKASKEFGTTQPSKSDTEEHYQIQDTSIVISDVYSPLDVAESPRGALSIPPCYEDIGLPVRGDAGQRPESSFEQNSSCAGSGYD